MQGDTSPWVLGSVAINLRNSPAGGPLLDLATAQASQGNYQKNLSQQNLGLEVTCHLVWKCFNISVVHPFSLSPLSSCPRRLSPIAIFIRRFSYWIIAPNWAEGRRHRTQSECMISGQITPYLSSPLNSMSQRLANDCTTISVKQCNECCNSWGRVVMSSSFTSARLI